MSADKRIKILNLLSGEMLEKIRPDLVGRPIRLSQVAEAILTLKGKPYSLKGRKIMRDYVMDTGYPQVLIMGGRQIEKSTTIAARMITMALTIPGSRSIYIAPAYEHRKEFARNVLKELVMGIPNWEDLFNSKQDARRVYELKFINRSIITTGYAPREGDQLRGKSGDFLYVDEIQDMWPSAVANVEHFLFHSDFAGGIRIYTGTAKTVDHTIHKYWESSTQGEFVIKCRKCGHDNVPGPGNVGEWGLVCEHCGSDLNLEDGRIVFARPLDGVRFLGIRFPQIVSPFVVNNPTVWHREIWGKIQRDGLSDIVLNEIFALPSGSVSRVVSRSDLMAVCNPYMKNSIDNVEYARDGIYVVGLDWGTGRVSNTAMSVLEVKKSSIPKVIFMKKWSGMDNEHSVDEIIHLLKKLPNALVVADFGFSGPELLPRLWRVFSGSPIRVYAMYSTGGRQAVKFDSKLNGFVVNPHAMLSNLFAAIKSAFIVFPRWEDTSMFSSEFTAWYINPEAKEKMTNKIYSHDYGHPVDVSITVAMALVVHQWAYYHGTNL